jgi:hypothetical protein
MFHAEARRGYDAALCMYHDQALIPIKTIDFDGGVNVTLGLPFVRTSPDHGTALPIAGTGRARAGSLIAALRLAAMCSCTSRSMRSPRSHVVFALVMRAASHDRDHALNSTPERLQTNSVGCKTNEMIRLDETVGCSMNNAGCSTNETVCRVAAGGWLDAPAGVPTASAGRAR